jgi:hypothetical protein
MPTLSLDAIEQRIAQRDAELQRLRRDFETRRSRLQALTQRKEELQAKLQQIEAEMAAVVAGAKRPQAASPKAAPKKPLPPSTTSKTNQASLASLIVGVMRSAGRPLTAKHLTKEVKRRGFKSSSADFTKVVGTRLWDLKKQGLVRQAPDKPGYILAPPANGPAPKAGPAQSQVQKPTAKAPAKKAKGKTEAAPAAKQAAGAKAPQKPLREVLTQILKKMGTPVTGSELAAEALKAGYHTTSKRFVDNIWTMLSQMDNVENVKGHGYRLKRGKS